MNSTVDVTMWYNCFQLPTALGAGHPSAYFSWYLCSQNKCFSDFEFLIPFCLFFSLLPLPLSFTSRKDSINPFYYHVKQILRRPICFQLPGWKRNVSLTTQLSLAHQLFQLVGTWGPNQLGMCPLIKILLYNITKAIYVQISLNI